MDEKFFIDFKTYKDMDQRTIDDLMLIQENYNPAERVEYLMYYRVNNIISDDDYETLTGQPYKFIV